MKDFLERTNDGEPRWWRSGAGGLARWKKEVKIGDLGFKSTIKTQVATEP